MTDGGVETVPDEAVDALREAADGDGVAFEALSVDRTAEGYRIEGPDGAERELSASALADAARGRGAHVAEWYFWERRAPEHPARRAFLRWVERADERPAPARREALAGGLSETWGQLRIAVRLAPDGRRTYDLRHVADADAPVDELSVNDDPAAVHDLARYDADGRYRPLKTAPTLAEGWVFPALDAAALVRAVDGFYPATIANWFREREGDLDVTHWREAAERQTGIYDLVDELAGEQVEWLAEACCVDSQCLKRRQWDESAAEPLDVPRSDGEFSCREPCSLVIAVAREVTLAERDEAAPASLELSRADLAQLERVLEAVASGEAGEVRDGDVGDGANRLRARVLRAKLFGGASPPAGGSGGDADDGTSDG